MAVRPGRFAIFRVPAIEQDILVVANGFFISLQILFVHHDNDCKGNFEAVIAVHGHGNDFVLDLFLF